MLYNGAFTIRGIVFQDQNDLTITSLLSDDATRGYLAKRFKVNDTFTYSVFHDRENVAISDIRITTGMGKDGVTNTFAAALWAIDMTISFGLMNGERIDFWHYLSSNNYQAIMGPGPNYEPQALYYGLLFGSLMRHGTPLISLPSITPSASQNVLAYGLHNDVSLIVIILNKEQNDINGTVRVKTGNTGISLNCIFLDAPSMDATSGFSIGGYTYSGGNSAPQGSFDLVSIDADSDGYYSIPFKTARAAHC